MTMPSGYAVVDVARERASEMLEVDAWGFAFSLRDSEIPDLVDSYHWERARGIVIADATRGAVGQLVAAHTSLPWQLRVPGGAVLATAGLTWVSVHQAHRRRGLLTAMIDDHFQRAIARGEAVSTLFAAETEIYQRFGYGLAARELHMELGRGVDLRPMPEADALTLTLETASLERHGAQLATFHAGVQRPGAVTNLPESFLKAMFLDAIDDREGGEPLRIAMVHDADTMVAYALFRRKLDWTPTGPGGKTKIGCYTTTTPASSHRLWSTLTNLDLMKTTSTGLIALDDPLVHQLVDERGQSVTVVDNVWLRILDIKVALEARGYSADANAVLEIEDAKVPANAGRWAVAVQGGRATVTRAARDAPVDLTMNIQELGSAYLGGVSLVSLASAGIVTEREPGAAIPMSRAMMGDMAPVSNMHF